MRISLFAPALALALAASSHPSAASDAPKSSGASSTASAAAAQAPGIAAPRPLPDLTIANFGVDAKPAGAGPCYLHFTVGVKNQGKASWPAAQHPAVLVRDQHSGILWETGVGIDPPIPPGQTVQIEVPMKLPVPDTHVTANPHPFKAFVNTNKVVTESSYSNNSSDAIVGSLKVINVDISPCKPPAPTPVVPR